MPRSPLPFRGHPISFAEAQRANQYRAVCQHVVDGDTIDCLIDVGFRRYPYEAIRIANIDTPEIFRPKSKAELELGLKAKEFVENTLLGRPVLLNVTGHSFDKYVAEVMYWPRVDIIRFIATDIAGWHLTKADVPAEGDE